MEVIGVDIGGTNIKVGTVRDGIILKESYADVNTKETESETFTKLFKCIDELFSKNIKAIGVGVTGVVDTTNGIVYNLQNIPSWKGQKC